MEEFAKTDVDVYVLAFEVYCRKNRTLLMLRALNKITGLERKTNQRNQAKLHYCLCKFLLKCKI
jgi:hypothetical protein